MASRLSDTQIEIPASTSTASVSIISTTTPLTKLPTGFFFGPCIKGVDRFSAVAFAFLVTRNDPSTCTTRKIVFDLGPHKEWRKYLDPRTAGMIQGWVDGGANINVSGDVVEEIAEGVKAVHGEGYPEKPTAAYLSSEVGGRTFEELAFDTSLKIGGYNALDFFGDRSFYLLEVPGHCVGHMNAPARVTYNPDSFVFMGADAFHHASQTRLSKGVPLPQTVDLVNEPISTGKFSKLHPSSRFKDTSAESGYDEFTAHSDFITTPFSTFQMLPDGTSIAHDLKEAREALGKLQKFDADERVFVVPAHDFSLHNVVEYFPDASANDWKEKGWKEKGRWLFPRDLEAAPNSTED